MLNFVVCNVVKILLQGISWEIRLAVYFVYDVLNQVADGTVFTHQTKHRSFARTEWKIQTKLCDFFGNEIAKPEWSNSIHSIHLDKLIEWRDKVENLIENIYKSIYSVN